MLPVQIWICPPNASQSAPPGPVRKAVAAYGSGYVIKKLVVLRTYRKGSPDLERQYDILDKDISIRPAVSRCHVHGCCQEKGSEAVPHTCPTEKRQQGLLLEESFFLPLHSHNNEIVSIGQLVARLLYRVAENHHEEQTFV